MKTHGGYVYLMTNKRDTVIYTGVTSNLMKRVYEHRSAIAREKQIKAGSRKKKIALIKSTNPFFKDLYSGL